MLLVGVGGAGTRVVDRVAAEVRPDGLWGRLLERVRSLFSRRPLDLQVLAADAPDATEGELQGLREGEVVALGSGPGTGGDIQSGVQAWRRDGGALREAAVDVGEWDLAVVVGAAGGGTAGAAMAPLVEALRSFQRSAPVVVATVLPFEREADRAHGTAGPALARLKDADPASILLLANDHLGSPEGALSEVYGGANEAVATRLLFLLRGLSEAGVQAVDRADLETTLSVGNGFSVLGYAEAREGGHAQDVVEEALSPEGASADVDPEEEAGRVLLLVEGDPDEFELAALLDRARELAPDREVLPGIRARPGGALRVLAVTSLRSSRAVEAVLDRFEALQASREEVEDPVGDRLEDAREVPPGGAGERDEPDEPEEEKTDGEDGVEEETDEPEDAEPDDGDAAEEGMPDGREEDGGEPEWVDDYRAAQQKAKELDIKANQKHEELIEQIREAEGDG